MDAILYILIIGLVGGLIHQLVDRGKENSLIAILRGVVIGGIAGWLTYISLLGQNIDMNTMYLIVFTSGYFGDSVILNIVERMPKNGPPIVPEE